MRITIELVVHDEDSLQSEQRKTVLELNRSTQTPASAGLGLILNEVNLAQTRPTKPGV